jgi:hypothetical protein
MMTLPTRFGSDEGMKTGPSPGDGASSVGGCPDADGTPNDALPPRPGEISTATERGLSSRPRAAGEARELNQRPAR